MTPAEKLHAIRQSLAAQSADAFVLPVTDEYQGEYSASYARRVTWLTGFDGSAGLAVILPQKAALFVDGRYTLQAAREIDNTLYDIFNSGEKKPEDYLIETLSLKESTTPSPLRERAGERATVAYIPWLHTHNAIDRLKTALEPHGISLLPVDESIVDSLWQDQPPRPNEPVIPHPLEFAGVASKEKRQALAEHLKEKNAAALMLSEPDAVCWLLNIRGGDIPFNPLPLCMAILKSDSTVDLFIEEKKISAEVRAWLGQDVAIHAPSALPASLKSYSAEKKLWIDPAVSASWFTGQLPKDAVLLAANPLYKMRAIKNPTEIAGMKRAHRADGRAIAKFIEWFRAQEGLPLTELQIVDRLEALRAESNEYRGPSFATISGAGPNGAIVHYRANEKTNRALGKDDILLLDSGGQYPFGTTDITRTLVRGAPSKEFSENYTRVLKGHIALAAAVFPKGTSGGQLDALARQYLWQAGLDFDHGTGHGVGAYLCVHEGPQRIGKRGGDVPLEPGMIVSNEPGYYKTGEYGIRIENLILVIEKKPGFYGFETLTLAPLEEKAILTDMLSDLEKQWIKDYHSQVAQNLK